MPDAADAASAASFFRHTLSALVDAAAIDITPMTPSPRFSPMPRHASAIREAAAAIVTTHNEPPITPLMQPIAGFSLRCCRFHDACCCHTLPLRTPERLLLIITSLVYAQQQRVIRCCQLLLRCRLRCRC